MDPKMTVKDAAHLLGVTERWVNQQLKKLKLPTTRMEGRLFFEHVTSQALFHFPFCPQVFVFQIVKGGTGKTSLAFEFSVRANLYGARVLCIDLDQQGNLSHAFQVDAENSPVMVDVLAEGYSFKHAIVPVYEGLDLLPSRIENSMLDEAIRLRRFPLNKVYKEPLQALKKEYDVIVVDCPPSLGQSVAAITLAADQIITPVVPEKFALSGLSLTYQAIRELETNFSKSLNLRILLNKYDPKSKTSAKVLEQLQESPLFYPKLLPQYIRHSSEFPQTMTQGKSLFDTTKTTIAKQDIDWLTRYLLELEHNTKANDKAKVTLASLEELFN